jgi:CheY-like chemotaxis protein
MKKNVLVIEESKAIRLLLKTVFQDSFQTFCASNASSAINWLSHGNNVNVIIVNPELPDTDSWELVEYLKTSVLYSRIPIIVLSSFEEAEVAAKCREFDIAKYLCKPFNPLDMKFLVSSAELWKNTSSSMKVAIV